MTALLQQVFAEAAKLSDEEQDLLALRLRAELAAEDDFDRAIARSSDKLAELARAALAEHQRGETHELDPQRLSIPVLSCRMDVRVEATTDPARGRIH